MSLTTDETPPANADARIFNRSDIATGAVLLAIMALMGIGRSAHYLLFHTMAELFAIVVSFSIFILTWVGQRYLVNGYLIVLGAAYGAIGLVDVFHTLTFRGMNLFPGVSTNYPTQFWLIARFLEALALLIAPQVISRKPNFYLVGSAFMAVALAASAAVTLQVFPATFVDGVGLTPFKVYAEYIIIAMLVLALFMLYRARQHFEPRILFLLGVSLVLAVATEFCFTYYGSFYDFTNELGHYFRFLTVALAFMAIVISGVRQPMDLIFREVDALNKKLSESELRMSAVFLSSPIGIVISRLEDGKILEINDAGLRLYHYSREQAVGRTVAELSVYVEPQQRVELLKLLREKGFVKEFLIDFRTHDGAVGVIETSARIIQLKGEACLLSMLTDVTERQRSQAQVYDQAFHDTLTNLPNRRLLGNRLQQAMVAAKRSGCFGALMFIDLDNFKPLNDQHGHDLGDLLLIEAAARLKGCVREMDTVARVGGDEFVVMLSELHADLEESRVQAATVAEKVRSALSQVYRLSVQHAGHSGATVEHLCTASIGVALFNSDEVAQDDLLNRADLAMYQAKRAGRNLIRFYESAGS